MNGFVIALIVTVVIAAIVVAVDTSNAKKGGPQIICPHCQTQGRVTMNIQRGGFAGSKVTTHFKCGNCRSRWSTRG